MSLAVDACDAFYMLIRFWEGNLVRVQDGNQRTSTEEFSEESIGLLSSTAVIVTMVGHVITSSWKRTDFGPSCSDSWFVQVE